MKHNLITALILTPFIFSIFFLAIRTICCYLLPRKTNQTNTENKMKNTTELRKLIQSTNGKFFSVVFRKKNGDIRRANGKDKYLRLLADSSSPRAGFNALEGTDLTSFVDRNKEGWISASDERLVSFKCGAIEKTF